VRLRFESVERSVGNVFGTRVVSMYEEGGEGRKKASKAKRIAS
jgi:hypothetical protein